LKKVFLRGFISALLMVIAFAFTQCGKPFGDKGDLTYSIDGIANPLAGGSAANSLAAFETTVYPLTRQHCVSCHSVSQQPVHASADPQTAHNALLSQYKINFLNPANSRIVMKLKENHQCWGNCISNAQQMEEAITQWAAQMSNGEEELPGGSNSYPFVTEPSLTIAQERQIFTNNTFIATAPAAASTRTAPMSYNSTNPGYIFVPVSGQNIVKSNNDNSAGRATFSVMGSGVNQNGGALWALVNAPDDSSNSFHVLMNGVNIDWHIPLTDGQFKWVKVTRGTNYNNQNFNLMANANTITIREREDGTQLARILWTPDQSFIPTGEGTAGSVTLSYDLSNLIDLPGARLEVRIEDYDAFSYRLSNLRVIAPNRSVHVRNVKVLINGQFNPQHANYTYINQTLPSGGGELSPSSMIILKEFGETQDKIAFAFEDLSLRANAAVSLSNFQTTVYPITRQRCIACHATTQRPYHASANPQTAHDELIEQYMVQFSAPDASRLVERLREGHHCWSNCETNAQQMENAIIQWDQLNQAP
jgi:hypothetical protein